MPDTPTARARALDDLAQYGVHITRDGERIAPEDFYHMPTPDEIAAQLKARVQGFSDERLIAAYNATDAEPGDAWYDAIVAEMKRRGVDD